MTDEENRQLLSLLQQPFPGATDWNVLESGMVEVFDKHDRLLGHTTITKLEQYLSWLGL